MREMLVQADAPRGVMSELTDLRCFCDICGGRVAFPPDASGTLAACPHCKQQILLKMSPEAMAEDGIILPGDDAPIPTKSVFKSSAYQPFALDDLVACRECGTVSSPARMARVDDDEWVCFECQPEAKPKPAADMQAAVQTEAERPTLGLRAFAKTIDAMIILALIGLVSVVFTGLTGRISAILAGWSFMPQWPWLLKFLGSGIVAYPLILIYHAAFIALKGATPGKLFCELEVIDSNGDRPTWDTATTRFLLETVMAFTLNIFFFQANYIIAAFDSQQRTYHDILAKTWVIMSRNRKKQRYF